MIRETEKELVSEKDREKKRERDNTNKIKIACVREIERETERKA